MKKDAKRRAAMICLAAVIVFAFAQGFQLAAQAAGLVDDTINAANEYSKYPLENYQLDFYVDNSWNWLPWNWKDGIGNSVMYGLYLLTNVIWTGSLYISNATGYAIQEAYRLDFISDMADAIGKNMQTLAGVSAKGISTEGFYAGFLLLFILILGIYVAYTGLIKHETSKAMGAVLNFVLVFILSGAFIAYAPDYVGKINDFSSDVSDAALTLGTKISMPNSESKGKDSVDLIRDSLFHIQVIQPWQLLQYGTTDVGEDRMKRLISVSPDLNSGEDREAVVKDEIESLDNTNLTLPKVGSRLGMVLFLFIFNIGISIFVFLLVGIMIFSQVSFIMYAMFLPISFLIDMLPTYTGTVKKAIEKVFNTIMMRAGITLIITVAFSISTMFYSISDGYPFFMTAFLQIITFAGIYIKLGDILSMFSLNGTESQAGSRLLRYPRVWGRRISHRMGWGMRRQMGRAAMTGGATANTLQNRGTGGRNARNPRERGMSWGPGMGSQNGQQKDGASESGQRASGRNVHKQNFTEKSKRNGPNMGQRMGRKAGAAMDMKNRIKENAGSLKENVKNVPLNARYAAHAAKKAAKDKVNQNVDGFKNAMTETREKQQADRAERTGKRRQTVAQRRQALERDRMNRNGGQEKMKKEAFRKDAGALKQRERPLKKEETITAEKKQADVVKDRKIPAKRPNVKSVSFSQVSRENPVQKDEVPTRTETVREAREPLLNGVPLSKSKNAEAWTSRKGGKKRRSERKEERGEVRNRKNRRT